ncbi:williams-beuren syndrome critical region protein-related [Anaeramoeba flamelloides]|uniref:Williams-beuren syndrome critical region protein-related n=1 Tax=Anaeramoeba flamelloides TaxID=1746091 RepID=A0ABQ8X933_9EUKA|nr:williams-beuren syndrome critical region protein-related [Anaeramoeba flamelloides]
MTTQNEFPELENLTEEEITKLLNDKDEFEEMFSNLNTVKNINSIKDQMMTMVADLLKINYSRKENFDEVKETHKLAKQRFLDLQQILQQKFLQQNQLLNQFDYTSLIDKIEQSKIESDEQADQLFQKVSQKEIDLDQFIKEFREIKEKSHLNESKIKCFQKNLQDKTMNHFN